MKQVTIVLLLLLNFCCVSHHNNITHQSALTSTPIVTGADQTEKYVPLLKGKRIAVLANPSTIIGKNIWLIVCYHLALTL